MKQIPLLLEKYFISNDEGKLNAMYCKMKDGSYVRSYYEKFGGPLHQERITKELYETKRHLISLK